MSEANFAIGQIVQHRLFNYRGVIIDVDYNYLGTDQWYDQVARSRPPKDQPWYHILVDNAVHQTYVAERNLEKSVDTTEIHHPMLQRYFAGMESGYYQLRTRKN